MPPARNRVKACQPAEHGGVGRLGKTEASVVEMEEFSERVQQVMAARLLRLLGQGGDGAVQELVLQPPEGALDVLSIFLR